MRSQQEESSELNDVNGDKEDDDDEAFATFQPADDGAVNNFDPADPIYKILCNCGVVPFFIVILSVQFFVSLAASIFSLYQIVVYENSHHFHHSHETPLNSTEKSPLNWSHRLEITFFLCQHWYPLIYIRFIILLVVIFSIGLAVYGLHAANVRFMRIYIVFIFIYILFLLTYMALLSWHAITYNDYFSFCFFGLILLAVLLLNVAALHTALVLCKFTRHMLKFWTYAVQRGWVDSETFHANRGHTNQCANYLFGKYEIPTELQLKLRQETKNHRFVDDRFRLREIEEAEDENDEKDA